LNVSALNEQEKGIARQMEKRRIVEEKREAGRKVIDAANIAQSKLEEVLTFDGGWLQEYEQDDDVDSPGKRNAKQNWKRYRVALFRKLSSLLITCTRRLLRG
jgi:hypothetical protein